MHCAATCSPFPWVEVTTAMPMPGMTESRPEMRKLRTAGQNLARYSEAPDRIQDAIVDPCLRLLPDAERHAGATWTHVNFGHRRAWHYFRLAAGSAPALQPLRRRR